MIGLFIFQPLASHASQLIILLLIDNFFYLSLSYVYVHRCWWYIYTCCIVIFFNLPKIVQSNDWIVYMWVWTIVSHASHVLFSSFGDVFFCTVMSISYIFSSILKIYLYMPNCNLNIHDKMIRSNSCIILILTLATYSLDGKVDEL